MLKSLLGAVSLLSVLLPTIAVGTVPALAPADRARLAEAFALADTAAELWPGWGEVPFAVLLLAGDHEYLVRHPAPGPSFTSLGYDDLLSSDVLHRPAADRYPPNILATFPAIGGVNTVVMGTSEQTGKSSTFWVLTALHEHFHQWQSTRPGYYGAVDALDLAAGDDTGMWQIQYPFAYDDPKVETALRRYAHVLKQAAKGIAPGAETVDQIVAARRSLRRALSAADDRYLDFQLWQEGIARYTEWLVARHAERHHEPLPAFAALADYTPYADAASALEAQLDDELREFELSTWRRVAFYPVGALEGLMLDALRPGWRGHYDAARFSLGRLLEVPRPE
ncbi:MAG: hypothetical protein AAFX85_02095 [Pseudomonadota bacterium]